MVAIVTSLIFVAAMFVALAVIASMISAERERIVGLLDGSLRQVALPHTIAIKACQVPHRAVGPIAAHDLRAAA